MRVPSIATALSLAPAGGGCAWAKFTNSGDGPLRQVDIHASPCFITEWIEQERT